MSALSRKRAAHSTLFFRGLRDGDQQGPCLVCRGIDLQAAHQESAAALDGVVGVQLARVLRVLSRELEVDLDLPLGRDLPRVDLKTAAAGQLQRGGALPVEI